MSSNPLLDTFKRGEVNRELKLLAAQAVVAPRADEQLELLVMLSSDPDAEIAAAAEQTIARIPLGDLAASLSAASPDGVEQYLPPKSPTSAAP